MKLGNCSMVIHGTSILVHGGLVLRLGKWYCVTCGVRVCKAKNAENVRGEGFQSSPKRG